MDWKLCAVDDLRNYNQMKIGILNSQDKLRMVRTSAKDVVLPVGSRRLDTRVINSLVETERLQENIKRAKKLVSLIDRGLASLTDEERCILEKFYMSGTPRTVTAISDELGYESRSIYRIREKALEKFTLAMYGVEVS